MSEIKALFMIYDLAEARFELAKSCNGPTRVLEHRAAKACDAWLEACRLAFGVDEEWNVTPRYSIADESVKRAGD